MTLIYSTSKKVNFTDIYISCMTEVRIMDNCNRDKGVRSLVIIRTVTVLISYIIVNALATRMSRNGCRWFSDVYVNVVC